MVDLVVIYGALLVLYGLLWTINYSLGLSMLDGYGVSGVNYSCIEYSCIINYHSKTAYFPSTASVITAFCPIS